MYYIFNIFKLLVCLLNIFDEYIKNVNLGGFFLYVLKFLEVVYGYVYVFFMLVF